MKFNFRHFRRDLDIYVRYSTSKIPSFHAKKSTKQYFKSIKQE